MTRPALGCIGARPNRGAGDGQIEYTAGWAERPRIALGTAGHHGTGRRRTGSDPGTCQVTGSAPSATGSRPEIGILTPSPLRASTLSSSMAARRKCKMEPTPSPPRLQGRWLARAAHDWLKSNAEIRLAPMTPPQSMVLIASKAGRRALLGTCAFTTAGLASRPRGKWGWCRRPIPKRKLWLSPTGSSQLEFAQGSGRARPIAVSSYRDRLATAAILALLQVPVRAVQGFGRRA